MNLVSNKSGDASEGFAKSNPVLKENVDFQLLFSQHRAYLNAGLSENMTSEVSKPGDVVLFHVNEEVDQELTDAFLTLREYQVDPKMRLTDVKGYNKYYGEFREIVDGLSFEQRREVESSYVFLNSLDRHQRVNGKLKKIVGGGTDSWKKDLFKSYVVNEKRLEENYVSKRILRDEFIEGLHKLDSQIVEDFDDEELNEIWENYEKDKKDEMKLFAENISAPRSNEKPVVDKDKIKQAFDVVSSSGMELSLGQDDSATIMIAKEFPVKVSVYRNVDSGELVYYMGDNYAESGVVRVREADLMQALDQRHIDAYLSKKLGKVLFDDYQSIGEIPDKDLVLLGERLLGSGESRNFKIEGEDIRIFQALIPVLAEGDSKYPNLYKKIRALNKFFEVKDNVDFARRELLSGNIVSVSKFIGP